MNKDKLKIAVLMGGRSSERAVSLRSGKNVINSLKNQGFKHVYQMDLEDQLTAKLLKNKIDVVFIALHGKFGEDGCVQGLLELAGIKYTGSGVLASALAMDKVQAKRIFQAKGIPTPNFSEIDKTVDIKKEAERIQKTFPFPVVVKPVSEGSSVGVTIVKEGDNLEGILKSAVDNFGDVFVEEYIKGKEVTVGILDEQALPILELAPKADFYDFEAKYTAGKTEFILPARLSKPLYKKTQDTALKAHRALKCKGLSRVDIIVSSEHVPFVHEVNTIPGLTDLSDLPAEAKHAGISFDALILRILQSAFKE
ncbi:MAG: D-alanine--D-alanine ligase [Candidatus Saganbacteria bacterium]|uniref:D-alanine--D-alanine ligase n=1 Tax=Candidatus Saganbacteria bacterium TaxID=2575572 RepID=A0A833L1J0_UNCSA|nr:MAG: D-alanine--D-alanine ligase [Candidatus Saganbacteria bacterium]